MILVAAALDANPTAAINAPIIVTTLHPKRFVKELAMGPAPSVTPTNIDGIKDTEARLVPSNPLINATTNIPKEYVIPSAEIEITLKCDSSHLFQRIIFVYHNLALCGLCYQDQLTNDMYHKGSEYNNPSPTSIWRRR